MAATQNVVESFRSSKPSRTTDPLVPKHGAITLFGFGIKVSVDRGHLSIEDGVGTDRRRLRLPRVGHGLRRLVVIGSDGMISLDALRWLADQAAAFVMLERDGKVLTTTGPVRSSDARLRRAQALANESGVALQIARELITQKLATQERLARHQLNNILIADAISRDIDQLSSVESMDAVRMLESRSAKAYWSAWAGVRIEFPRNELGRVPEHWRTFGTRHSLLTGSPRLAVNPPNAILNYLYAVLESEASLAAAVVGLDPGLGVLHMDAKNRDSLACDLMEPVRAEVDAFVLDWIGREPLRRADFFETETGNCRLMSSLCRKLSETAPVWGRLVAPWAEHLARTLWAGRPRSKSMERLSTPLTQQHEREAKGRVVPSSALAPRPQKVCRGCGAVLEQNQRNHCALCGVNISRANMIEIAKRGRPASRSAEARAKQSAIQKQHRAAIKGWLPSSLPAWLTQSSYRELILPRLAGITIPEIARTLNVSEPYAAKLRKGQHVPHPMHWQALAELAGVSGEPSLRSPG
jgi:CRISPR-associated endonuclease Cas1